MNRYCRLDAVLHAETYAAQDQVLESAHGQVGVAEDEGPQDPLAPAKPVTGQLAQRYLPASLDEEDT